MYSKKEKKQQYHHTDQGLIWESTWKKEKQYPSKRYTLSVTTNCKNLIDTSKKNEDREWIRRVKSERASPIMFVKKKDVKLRLCADYRALNEVAKKDRHPLPLITEALDRLGGAK